MFLRRCVYIFGIASTLLFFVLTIYCMSIYPGGIVTDHHTEGYSFFKNYFSDLGRTHNFLGQSNFTSMVVFIFLVNLIGLATVLYYISTPYFFSNSIFCKRLSMVGSFMGFIAGIGYMGIGFTPADILMPLHLICVKIAFHSFFITVILYSTAIFKNPIYPNLYAYVYLAFGVGLAMYLFVSIWGPSGKTPEGLAIQAGAQKLVVYSQILCMMIQAYGSWQLNNKYGNAFPS